MTLELEHGRRAFPEAQQLLAAEPRVATRSTIVGWHGTAVSREDGSFALVGFDAELDDWIGEVLAVRFGLNTVYAYVLGNGVIDEGAELSLTRRVYGALARLGSNQITADVGAT